MKIKINLIKNPEKVFTKIMFSWIVMLKKLVEGAIFFHIKEQRTVVKANEIIFELIL